MDSLKKFGAVFASHYEKIILSAILLALLGAAAFLPFRVAQNRQTIEQALETLGRPSKKESEPVDTSTADRLLRRARLTPELELSGDHNLFNPVLWKSAPNGMPFKMVRGDEDGAGGLSVVAIRPLHFRVDFEGIQMSGDSIRYKFVVVDQAKGGRTARPRQHYMGVGSASKRDPFVVAKVNGPEAEPTSLEIRFVGSNDSAVVSLEKGYERIAGYEADMVHEKVGSKYFNVRAKQPGGIRLGAQTYNIVAITKDEVTLESSSRKRWTIRLKGTP